MIQPLCQAQSSYNSNEKIMTYVIIVIELSHIVNINRPFVIYNRIMSL